ncbi:MAG: hypothetical protein PHI97_28540 [Desulfobulbus sp.]|nr:hypothetical protein [Desulfobulbus sp.]
MADGLVQLRQREEPLVSQLGQDLPLNDLDCSATPSFVQLAKPAVLAPIQMLFFVLLPEQFYFVRFVSACLA